VTAVDPITVELSSAPITVTVASTGLVLSVASGTVGPAGAQGPAGPAGATGATGAQGPAGQGVPVGGSTGQVLSKVSGTDYDTTWSTVSGGGGAPAAHAASHQDGGSDELALDASQLTSGTVATARLGSGTANGARYLAGNQTWALPYSYWLRLAFSNADYTVSSSQSAFVMQTGTLSAARVVTLPSTASFAAGQEVILWSGAGVSATNTLTVQGASSQTINGSGTTFVITQPNRLVRFVSNANTGITATNPNWVVDTFDVDGSQITSGTVPFARLPVGTTSTTVAVGDDARLSDARTPTAHKVSHQAGGSDELALSAAQLTSGTVATARLGSGTANSGAYLRGDQTYAHPIVEAFYVTGRYYPTPGVTSGGTRSLASGAATATPFPIYEPVSVDSLQIDLSAATASGQSIDLHVVTSNASGDPDSVVFTVNVTTTGTIAQVLSTSTTAVALTPGLYYVVAHNRSANALTARTVAAACHVPPMPSATVSTANQYSGWLKTPGTSAITSYPAVTAVTDNVNTAPIVSMRFA
jgi:hypothetical protein